MWSGSKRNECPVALRPLLFAKTPVFAVCGCKVLPLKSPWARPNAVILGGFSAIACSVRQEPWLLAASCSGGALISPLSPTCFPLEAMSAMGEPELCILLVPGLSCHLVPPTSCTHTHTHTKGVGPWASCTRWAGAHLLPEPLSMLGGAAGMGHVGTRGTRWYGVNSLIPFSPHVVVCVQGQMGVFTTQHFHNPVCFHLTSAQVKWEAVCLCPVLLVLASGLILQRSGSPQEAKASG